MRSEAVQSIYIQWRDGRPDETRTGEDLAAEWEELTDSAPGIQYAIWRRPGRTGPRAAGITGEPRSDRAERLARQGQAQAERDRLAEERRYASRDWTWQPYVRTLGTG